MAHLIYLVVFSVAIGFWLIQVLDLLFRDLRFFESHTHKLVWFLVLVSGNIIGAVWYYIWRRQTVTAMSVPGRR